MLGIDRRKDKGNKEYQNLKKGIIPKMRLRERQLVGMIPKKDNGEKSRFDKSRYLFAVDAPFKISNYCCNVMKKYPVHKYGDETGRHPMVATMAEESYLRQSEWLKRGCNSFEGRYPLSKPLSFWTNQDVLHYIKDNNLPICSVYGEIVADESKMDVPEGQMELKYDGTIEESEYRLKTSGCDRTGCMFCGFGCHNEKGIGRFERMKLTHPKQYEWIMKDWEKGGLGYKKVIDWINENGNLNIRY